MAADFALLTDRLREARVAGRSFGEAWTCAVAVLLRATNDAVERDAALSAAKATRSSWERAFKQAPPTAGDRAAARLAALMAEGVSLGEPGTPPSLSLGERATRLRVEHGLRYRDIGARLGVSEQQAQRLVKRPLGELPQRARCARGHPLDGARGPDGRWRRCRECARLSAARKRADRAYRERQQAAQAASGERMTAA